MKIDGQNHDADREHPQTQNRQKPQHSAEQEPEIQQDTKEFGSRKSDRMPGEPDPVTLGPRLRHRDQIRLPHIEFDIAMPGRTR
jgi:hypothetical protein